MSRRETKIDHVPLPVGLTIRWQGESIETVASKAGEVRLLMSEQSYEVHESTLSKGERITLVPSGFAVETYYLLEGVLHCDLLQAL